MICKPQEFVKDKYYVVMITGIPGGGKSTLALSAPDPLHVDPDRGIRRVEPQFRRSFIQPQNYEELLRDLEGKGNLDQFKSIIIDTGGTLVKHMTKYLIDLDANNSQKDGRTLSLKGYGAISDEFTRLMDFLTFGKQKNVILVFHVKDQSKSGDVIKYILDIAGSTKTTIWQRVDFGGLLHTFNNNRVWGVTPCDEYDAKCTQGLNKYINNNGLIEIPDTKHDNTFLADLFNKLDEGTAYEAELLEKYNFLMAEIQPIIKAIKDIKSANMALELFKEDYADRHIFGSKQEIKTLFSDRLKQIGLECIKGEIKKIENN